MPASERQGYVVLGRANADGYLAGAAASSSHSPHGPLVTSSDNAADPLEATSIDDDHGAAEGMHEHAQDEPTCVLPLPLACDEDDADAGEDEPSLNTDSDTDSDDMPKPGCKKDGPGAVANSAGHGSGHISTQQAKEPKLLPCRTFPSLTWRKLGPRLGQLRQQQELGSLDVDVHVEVQYLMRKVGDQDVLLMLHLPTLDGRS